MTRLETEEKTYVNAFSKASTTKAPASYASSSAVKKLKNAAKSGLVSEGKSKRAGVGDIHPVPSNSSYSSIFVTSGRGLSLTRLCLSSFHLRVKRERQLVDHTQTERSCSRNRDWLGIQRRFKVIWHLLLDLFRNSVDLFELLVAKVRVLRECQGDGVISDIISICNVDVGEERESIVVPLFDCNQGEKSVGQLLCIATLAQKRGERLTLILKV